MTSLSSIIIEYSVAFLMIIIILTSVLGNLLVCLAICIERRLRNAGAGNYYLISLALADLLVGLLVMTLSLAYSLMGRWVFGELMCRVWISMDVMCCTSSILNLCAICIDRFLHIKDPYNYDTYMSRKVVVLSIFVIWSLSATISFVPLNLGWHKLDIFQFVQPHETNSNNVQLSSKHAAISALSEDSTHRTNKLTVSQLTADQPSETSKDELNCDLEFSPVYAVVSSSISFYLPCIIMVALYTRLYLCARKHVRDIRKQCQPQFVNRRDDNANHHKAQDSPPKANNTLSPGLPHTGSDRSNRSCRSAVSASTNAPNKPSQRSVTTINQHVADHKAAITIGIILSAFLLCWIPFFLMNIYLSFCNDCVPSSVFQSLTWLGWCNSALNPIIYTIFNREFRSAFYRLLTTWPLGNCSLLKFKHRFTQPTKAQPKQMELRSRATGSSECSLQQPAGTNHAEQQNDKPIAQQPQTINRSQVSLPNIRIQTSTLEGALARTEIVQLQSNLNIDDELEEIKRLPIQEGVLILANKNKISNEQTNEPKTISTKGSINNQKLGNGEQQEKMTVVSIRNSSKDAVTV